MEIITVTLSDLNETNRTTIKKIIKEEIIKEYEMMGIKPFTSYSEMIQTKEITERIDKSYLILKEGMTIHFLKKVQKMTQL